MAKSNFIQDEFLDKGISTKRCKICKLMKPVEQFSPLNYKCRGGVRTTRHTWCNECKAEEMRGRHRADPEVYRSRARNWQKQNKETYKKTNRHAQIKHAYGLTKEQYDKMFNEQGNKCAICKMEETCKDNHSGLVRRLAVDHCHQTNKVRQLLCHACNRGLAGFRDDPSLFRAAADYIERHRSLREAESEPIIAT